MPEWVLGAVVTLVVPALLVGSPDLAWTVVTAAVVVALATALTASRWTAYCATRLAVPRVREHHDVRAAVDGPATDPVHHPVRPRAPGLA
ncbi:hypothetical protein GCM10009623_32900 [Nocardioides aestuarii]